MTEKNDKLKPPARRPRPKGHVDGGAKKAAAVPPPPAELTREHLVAEQSHPADADLTPPSMEDSGRSSQSAADPVDSPTTTHEASARQESGQVRSTSEADPEPTSTSLPVPSPAEEPSTQTFTPPVSAPPLSPAHGSSEVALRGTAPAEQGTSFPTRAGAAAPPYQGEASAESASNEGAPWTKGTGRPTDIPEAAAVLNQHHITRESLDASVPSALRLKKRIKRFALDNDLDHLPIGDIVCVAMDEWLSRRGF
ncbi:hypothetical protein GTY75_24270 [Streptomyces sp. SID8381]|uniref:hypothetical protein n=1 Tax=unclassified Streptomyces TaxID=2593676 RepID=UPI000481A791|nr:MULTISPECIES: hypothetical protein [unclassified Streptomyces]MYX29716.1 hypothetical protein [Streptomyces sp. SID8381]